MNGIYFDDEWIHVKDKYNYVLYLRSIFIVKTFYKLKIKISIRAFSILKLVSYPPVILTVLK